MNMLASCRLTYDGFLVFDSKIIKNQGEIYMIKSIKKVLPFAFAGVIAFSNYTSVQAAGGTLAGGTLNFTTSLTDPISENTTGTPGNSAVAFNNIGTIDVDVQGGDLSSVTATEYIRVDDNRGTNEGWNVKVSASNLVATITDKTVASGTVTVNIPISEVLKVSAGTLTAHSGTTTNVTANTTATSLANSGVNVLTALVGYGAGAYSTPLTYTLTMPIHLPTGTTFAGGATGTKYTDARATEIGTPAGAYETTITYSFTTAP
jgi:hypothetical protein